MVSQRGAERTYAARVTQSPRFPDAIALDEASTSGWRRSLGTTLLCTDRNTATQIESLRSLNVKHIEIPRWSC
jgi:hypothetical protein